MFKLFARKDSNKDLKKVAKEQLKENRAVIESLRDYDAGKKDISTSTARERLPDIRVAS